MHFIRPLQSLSQKDVTIAGGKGASLGELIAAGIPVPSGFVIVSGTFDAFIKSTGLDTEIDAILDTVDTQKMHTVESASEKIHALIDQFALPINIETEIQTAFTTLGSRYVAVRSSATAEDGAAAAWAGQLETYLNTTEATLLPHIKKCWASLFSPRAIFYRFQKGFHDQHISVAVVVQTMVESEKSGIAFSVHPVTQDRNQLIIEAGLGLGEAVVSGTITPDSYVVHKDTWSISEKQIHTQERGLYRAANGGNQWQEIPAAQGSQSTLSDNEVIALAKLVTKIEKHYGFPVDVEWATVANQIFITQSRAITTLQNIEKKMNPLEIHDHTWFLAVTRNMSFWHQCLMVQGWRHHYDSFDVPGFINCLSLTVDGTESHCFLDADEYRKNFLLKIEKIICNPKKLKQLEGLFQKNAKQLLMSLKRCLGSLNEKRLSAFFRAYQQFTPGLQITTGFGKYGTEELQNALQKAKYSAAEIPSIIGSITYPDKHTPLSSSQRDLLKIAAKIQQKKLTGSKRMSVLKEWLKKYQNIPVNYCEEPWTIVDVRKQLQSMLKKNCAAELRLLDQNHRDRITQKQKQLRSIRSAHIRNLANGLATCTYLNEYRKNIFSTVSLGYRPMFAKLARKGGSKNWRDCFFCTPEELLALTKGEKISIRRLKKQRQSVAILCGKNGKTEILNRQITEGLCAHVESLHSAVKTPEKSQTEIRGFSASQGIVRGTVKVVLSSKEFAKFKSGDILVTTMTSVDFVPIMEKAAAFVTNEGGVTSHASIVAREMNKPCILATKNATSILKDGDEVEVDANQGVVRLLSKTPEIEWVHYITRPFTLLGASLWREWYGGEAMLRTLGVTNTEAQFLEVYPNVVRYYREKKQMEALQQAAQNIILNNPKKLKAIFARGKSLHATAEKMLLHGWKSVPNLAQAVETIIEIAMHATVVPFLTLAKFDEMKVEDKELRKMAEYLRGKSIYPRFFAEIVTPHAEHIVKELKADPASASLLTIGELRKKDISSLPQRLKARRKNLRFIYTFCNGTESVEWTNKIAARVHQLEQIANGQVNSLRGQTAYPGKIRGRARLVLTDNPKGITFHEGDILISINSTPSLMPLIEKCAAMVTDEGGISCHAAIVSRELQKPCVMSTKMATSIIKDGDDIEVDANQGIVRIIKSAGKPRS